MRGLAYLFTRGLNLPGNSVFGDASLQLEMDFRGLWSDAAAARGPRFKS